jgi:phosphoribosylformylglycinamidine synthase
MLWEVEIVPKGPDAERNRICAELDLMVPGHQAKDIVVRSARGYLFEGDLDRGQAEQLMAELLVDPLAETGRLVSIGQGNGAFWPEGHPAVGEQTANRITVLLKPGVMDPAAQSVLDTAGELGFKLLSARTFRRYYLQTASSRLEESRSLLGKVLANDAIEQLVEGPISGEHLGLGSPYRFHSGRRAIRELDDASLRQLSRDGQLSLSLAEMQAIQAHFRRLGREPTDIELETVAQTWSEHCSHKTLKGKIDFEGRRYENLLKETIFAATQEIRRRLGPDDWCVSVFEDNAGIIRFDEQYNICFKVETHNHPSAIEPYGGANTGLGGVIRDVLGTGLGARPICNTDVFCFAPPDLPPESLPPGVLHPSKVIRGVVAGVRDYGNRMGIPTVNGAVCFEERYLGNPLVFCGTVGVIPNDRSIKEARADDLIVAVGGRTGRDGIHGATFSSIELTEESERVSGGAVQIGNAITEKKVLDVILQARDLGLYHAITDCGAGGFSSAIGEMGEKTGATVHLDKTPLKYQGLSYTEIWISEAQERMVLAVPPEHWSALKELCAAEDVEATVLGHFENTGRLRLLYEGNVVADLEMDFLHHGRPVVVRRATDCAALARSVRVALPESAKGVASASTRFANSGHAARTDLANATHLASRLNEVLLRILSSYNVCSKEWIIRQYDHEVQGGTVIKPLVGVQADGPGDAAVILPELGSWTGVAIGCGINPRYGDFDSYRMAAAAIDEAVRNVVAVGADPTRIALLDNFCWGNTDRPEVLGSLVRAAEACRDVALAFNMPFISGKDSLNNEFHSGERHITIPPTLLISALGLVRDVRRAVTMDLKEPGNVLFLVGETRPEMGGSHYNLITGQDEGEVPQVDPQLAPRLYAALHRAIELGLVRACHDLSEGGLAVALAEMAFAGGLGVDVTSLVSGAAAMAYEVLLFSESASRFLVETTPANADAFRQCLGDQLPVRGIGQSCKEPRLRVAGRDGEWILWARLSELKEAWQKPLRW